ncbi:MAG: hypothetical protein R2747_02595 [Pyrinomonadaceae bacterium]
MFRFSELDDPKIFGREESAKTWDRIILERMEGDEEKALDHFFDLLEEFKLEMESDAGGRK